MVTTTLNLDDVDLVYDVHGLLPTEDGRPPLLLIGQPMDASGFSALAAEMADRTTVTYDPRGLGRSARRDGRVDHDPQVQATDVRAIVDDLDVGVVDVFASSGGAVTALALVAAHGGVVRTLIAHEPPLLSLLPDNEAAVRSQDLVRQRYEAEGFGGGMAAFIAQGSWQGEFDDTFFAQAQPDPAAFGLPTDDDGSRDDPLLSDRSLAITRYQPDRDAINAAPTRVVIAVGEESVNTVTGRCAVATAQFLSRQPSIFPSHHGGFMGGEYGYAGQPQAFAARLGEVLNAS